MRKRKSALLNATVLQALESHVLWETKCKLDFETWKLAQTLMQRSEAGWIYAFIRFVANSKAQTQILIPAVCSSLPNHLANPAYSRRLICVCMVWLSTFMKEPKQLRAE